MAAYKWVVGDVTKAWLQDVNDSLKLDANDDVSVVAESDAGCNEGWHVQDRHGEWDVTIAGQVEMEALKMVEEAMYACARGRIEEGK